MRNHTTVLLVDDHAMVRDGIRSLLEQSDRIEVIAEAQNGREGVALAAKHAPDIVLIDISMPDLNGLEATRLIHASDPKIAVIALTMYSEERYVTGIFQAGGRGYLLKTCDGDELMRAIDAVMQGSLYVTPALTHALIGRPHTSVRGTARNGTPPLDALTPREREILQLIAEGLTSKEIGGRLNIALKTVESHRTNVIRKLDLHSIAHLTKYAIREGLTDLAG
jgi:two-component system response regulator NreC